jgi:DNA polymerase kappa
MEQLLVGLDINTCQDIRDRADELKEVLSEGTFKFLLGCAWGYSRNYHVEGEDSLSVSC